MGARMDGGVYFLYRSVFLPFNKCMLHVHQSVEVQVPSLASLASLLFLLFTSRLYTVAALGVLAATLRPVHQYIIYIYTQLT